MLRTVLSPLTFVFLGTTLFAQAPAPFAQSDERFHYQAFTLPSHTGNYGRTLTGDLDGDLRPELICLLDGRLAVIFGASCYDAPFLFDIAHDGCVHAVDDIDLVPRDPSLGYDSLLILHGGVLSRLDWVQPANLFHVATMTGPDYSNARQIHVADLDRDGRPDLVSIDHDDSVNIEWNFIHSDILEQHPPVTRGQILDFTTAQYDTTTDSFELVFVTTQGVEIYRPGGSLVEHMDAIGFSDASMQCFSQSNAPSERIVFCGTPDFDPMFYHLFVFEAGQWELPEPCGYDLTASLATGDIDLDGRDESMVRTVVDNDIYLAWNTEDSDPYTPTFSMAQTVSVSSGHGSEVEATHPSRPILIDIDHDGDLDLASFSSPHDRAALQRNHQREHYEFAASLPRDVFYDVPSDTLPQLSFTVDRPVLPPNDFPSPELETTVWQRRHPQGSVDPVATRHDFFPGRETSTRCRVTIDTPSPHSLDVHYIVYRYVQRAGDQVIAATPDRVIVFWTGDSSDQDFKNGLEAPVQIGTGAQPHFAAAGDPDANTEWVTQIPCLIAPPDDDAPSSEGNL